MPESTAEVTSSTDKTQRWKVVVGRKRGGPFGTTQLRQLVDDEKLPADAFVRDEDDAADWFEVQSCEWLTDFPERHSARYCPECDCRVIISHASSDKLQRCPGCSAPVKFVDFLNVTANPQLDGVSVEPWGKFDVLTIVAAMVALAAGFFGALSLLWNPPFAVLMGFIFLVLGSGLFSITFHHRSRASKYLGHLAKVEHELESRTNQLFGALTELRALKRNVAQVHSDLVEYAEAELRVLKRNLSQEHSDLVADAEAEFKQQRDELAEQLEIAKYSANAVNRMAERFLNETLKWWNSKLNSENYQATKDRLTKAIDFCRKQGHKVSVEIERHLVKQVQMEYEIVLRREREKSEQKRIREQMREEQRVEREVKRELERIEAEKRAIEKALKEAMQKVGAEHSAEVELLREKLREAEERGVRTQAQAELTKVGNVYVISNIGSFGENVFKVGLTRRLEPLDRVKELGDASVPFTFDVHMMIFSEDAPRLEYALHQALHKYRVNRVNFRKEFFRVDLETIRTVVEEHHGVVEYVADAEALQYRESLNISEEDFEYLAKVADAAGVEDEDDDLDGADEP